MAIHQRLADANRGVTDFQRDLATSRNNIAWLLSATGDSAGAWEMYNQAQAIHQKLADANPNVTALQRDLANDLLGMGWFLLETGKPGEAVAYFSREEAIWKTLADANPTVPEYRNSLANCQTNTATVLLRLGRPAEARAALRAGRGPPRGAGRRPSRPPPVSPRARGEPSPVRAGAPRGAGLRRGIGRLEAGDRSLRDFSLPGRRTRLLPRGLPCLALVPRRAAGHGSVGRRGSVRGRSRDDPVASGGHNGPPRHRHVPHRDRPRPAAHSRSTSGC